MLGFGLVAGGVGFALAFLEDLPLGESAFVTSEEIVSAGTSGTAGAVTVAGGGVVTPNAGGCAVGACGEGGELGGGGAEIGLAGGATGGAIGGCGLGAGFPNAGGEIGEGGLAVLDNFGELGEPLGTLSLRVGFGPGVDGVVMIN